MMLRDTAGDWELRLSSPFDFSSLKREFRYKIVASTRQPRGARFAQFLQMSAASPQTPAASSSSNTSFPSSSFVSFSTETAPLAQLPAVPTSTSTPTLSLATLAAAPIEPRSGPSRTKKSTGRMSTGGKVPRSSRFTAIATGAAPAPLVTAPPSEAIPQSCIPSSDTVRATDPSDPSSPLQPLFGRQDSDDDAFERREPTLATVRSLPSLHATGGIDKIISNRRRNACTSSTSVKSSATAALSLASQGLGTEPATRSPRRAETEPTSTAVTSKQYLQALLVESSSSSDDVPIGVALPRTPVGPSNNVVEISSDDDAADRRSIPAPVNNPDVASHVADGGTMDVVNISSGEDDETRYTQRGDTRNVVTPPSRPPANSGGRSSSARLYDSDTNWEHPLARKIFDPKLVVNIMAFVRKQNSPQTWMCSVSLCARKTGVFSLDDHEDVVKEFLTLVKSDTIFRFMQGQWLKLTFEDELRVVENQVLILRAEDASAVI